MSWDEYSPRFTALTGQHGVRVDDPIEDVEFRLFTPDPATVEPVEADAAPWCFPIGSAARVDANEFQVPLRIGTYVRRPDGSLVASGGNDESIDVPVAGPYIVELTSTPIKLFVHAESRVEVSTGEHRTTIAFPDVDGVQLGARSLHKQPARTLTTTHDMRDVMRVVSEFGAALKTTTCERSFPTLRGHPPLVEFGEAVEVPGGDRRPETGVRIEVPPEPEYVYPVVPLAYYLGAEVVPGADPALATDRGFSYALGPDVEGTTKRTLRQVFTLDCLTRVEGFYPVDLHERREAEELGLDLPWVELYDQPLAEQLETYLSVPYEEVEPVVPEWRLTADIVPNVEYATVLPYLANELASVRIFTPDDATLFEERSGAEVPTDEAKTAIDTFARTPPSSSTSRVRPADDFVRGPVSDARAGGSTRQSVSTDDVLRMPSADTATQTYIGDGFPLNANKGSQASYERQLQLRTDTTGRISVEVVCNDAEMLDELEVGDHYGTRDLFDFDVTVHSQLSRAALREVLATDADLVHYIGHVDKRGLQASDGYLDAHDLETVGTTAFVLNGCRSFRQGQALVDRGAIAGIVTLENVHNSLATQIGTNIARLLNRGWPLDAAVEVVKDDALVGRHYIVIGDGSVEVAKADSGNPTLNIVDPREWDDDFDVTIRAFATKARHLGSLYSPYIGENDQHYLASGNIDTFRVSTRQLEQYFSLETDPVQLGAELKETTVSLRWSDELDVESIRSLLE